MTMAFNPATGLLNTSIYPTTPVNETAARQQFMDLFNQLKDYLNNSVMDANGNVIANFPTSKGQNPNLLFNPSGRMGFQGWTNTGGGAWNAGFGVTGDGGFFQVTSSSATGTSSYYESARIPSTATTVFTLSGEIYAGGQTAGQVPTIQLYAYDVGNVSLGNVCSIQASALGTGWAKYTAIGTTPANTSYLMVRIVYWNGSISTSTAFKKIKVEGGSIATTFSDDNTLNIIQYSGVLGLSQVLSGGYKVQNGQVSVVAATGGTPGVGVVTFPIAFSSPPMVLPSIGLLSAGESGYVTLQPNGITSTGFNARVTSYIAQTVQFNWIALGT